MFINNRSLCHASNNALYRAEPSKKIRENAVYERGGFVMLLPFTPP
jgi:hypothetical protein